MTFIRSLRHLLAQRWLTRRKFNARVLADIEKAIGDHESRHSGELRFVVETSLELGELWRGLSPRERAAEVFAQLGVWDTAENNGVLIYVLLADRDVEILADRGIAARVTRPEWEQVCRDIEGHYRAGRFGPGSVAGIRDVGALLARHFPGARAGRSELPDQPVLL
jgi:hypothetical protein